MLKDQVTKVSEIHVFAHVSTLAPTNHNKKINILSTNFETMLFLFFIFYIEL